jgi:hypothetical protein
VQRELSTQKFLPKNKIPVLQQPSYTLDLSPADIFLFPKLEVIDGSLLYTLYIITTGCLKYRLSEVM